MVVKKVDVKGGIKVYVVDKDYSDEILEAKVGTLLSKRDCKVVVDHDADIYNVDGKLILRFRKNVLPQRHIDAAFENLIAFAKIKTRTRGTASATEYGKKYPGSNNPIMSNIIGYFDKWTIKHKHIFKTVGIKPPFKVRVSSFTSNYPDKWAAVIPLIQDIDRMYKKLVPQNHKLQLAAANETAYHIPGTAFTTVTTNVNFQTGCHRDSGDFSNGFGNLVVIEKGKYKGGYTVFPQYGIGVDVRTCDFLAMDVHQVHGNVPIIPITNGAIRMSLVSYLREDVWKKSKGTTLAHVKRNISTMNNVLKRYQKVHVKMPRKSRTKKLPANST